MSRRRRRAQLRRLHKAERRYPLRWWLIPLALAIVLVLAVARALR